MITSHFSRILISIVALLATIQTTINGQTTTEWPNLPLLSIETIDGQEPTASVVYPPEGCIGVSILSEHVPGHLVMTLGDKTLYDSGDYVKGESGMRMKIRGNTSGAFKNQHPYKLKLSKKADLLNIDNNIKSKDWALLSMDVSNKAMKNGRTSISPIVGLATCRCLEMPWTPKTRLVNLVLNGKYKGLYHLIETVERADCRIKTDKSGFIIENNAYWWKEGEAYFKTDHQHQAMGYTFKYPDADDLDASLKDAIKEYINKVEDALYNNTGINEYIDIESFAKWVLIHDILGTYDSAGSNMYLYKESFGNQESEDTKLKMGTPWDFDSMFMTSDNEWGRHHTDWSNLFIYPQLFKNNEFCQKYLELYNKYSDKVYPYIEAELKKLKQEDGEAFDQSVKLHVKEYPGSCENTLDEQIDDVLSHLKTRLKTLETLTAELTKETSIKSVATGNNKLIKRVNIYGIDYTNTDESQLPKNIYIEKYSNGTVKKVYK